MRFLLGLMAVAACAGPAFAAGRAMTIDDLLAVKSVSDPQVSPDGKLVVYVVSELDRATDKSNSDLYLIPSTGGEPKRLTTASGADNHPRWSPDGKSISFLSTRGGSAQVWILPLEGGEARPLTKLPIDVSGPLWSPAGDLIAFTASVYPGKTPEETAEIDEKKGKEKSKVKIYDKLMIRHWDTWEEGKKSHLFVADVATGMAKDLTPKLEANVPPAPFGGSSDYAFAPNGKELAFTAEPIKDHPWSTNTDIWIVSTSGNEPQNLTEENPGADGQPSYSPDGDYLAYVSQARAGFEADRWALMVRDRSTGEATDVIERLDRSAQSIAWGSSREVEKPFEGKVRDLFVVLDDSGSVTIRGLGFLADGDGHLFVNERSGGISGGVNNSPQVLPGGDDLVFVHGSSNAPNEIYRAKPDGSGMAALTHHNAELLASLDLPKAEGFTFPGADGDEVSGWLIRPPGFDPSKKYPVLFLIHGGPQGAWHDEWHGRWNYELFAAPGYAVVAINPRGSTGYGQKFTDQISKDWTGRVFEDLMKGLDHALKAYPFLDGSKMAAAGGSYGGFMVNWIAGHTDRFKALISHAGVFDLASMYGTTEELWFAEWEFGGVPWESPKIYLEQTPSAFVGNFKTPTLVIHGSQDFRVPEAQGLGMFTSLQRQGVRSRFVLFPDEGHWIARPANRIIWWREVHDWLAKYLK
ncbi:S9 family peptidase [Tundrisphaera lichenicola]|uniref:S9 family peptidase n=1 Tax=Tundrisphaera lichenicola TaxID=2029860 RepID=UPI003EB82B6F